MIICKINQIKSSLQIISMRIIKKSINAADFHIMILKQLKDLLFFFH